MARPRWVERRRIAGKKSWERGRRLSDLSAEAREREGGSDGHRQDILLILILLVGSVLRALAHATLALNQRKGGP